MDKSKKKQEEKEFEAAMLAFALDVASSSVTLPYAPRKLHLVTGLQWVEEKEKDAKSFYAMFRMRRSVFHTLHDLLVQKYGPSENLQHFLQRSIDTFFYGAWVHVRQLIMSQIGLHIVVLSLIKNSTRFWSV